MKIDMMELRSALISLLTANMVGDADGGAVYVDESGAVLVEDPLRSGGKRWLHTIFEVKLTDEEFALMKQHSVLGYRIIQDKKDISEAVKMGVLQHHEKMNGTGYPFGYASDKIVPYAKILSIADVYDALVTERPYKKSFSQRTAVEMIMSMTAELDITAMRSFMESVILYPVDTTVSLSNGEQARVVENKPNAVLRPTVVGLKSGIVYNLSEDLTCASIVIQ